MYFRLSDKDLFVQGISNMGLLRPLTRGQL